MVDILSNALDRFEENDQRQRIEDETAERWEQSPEKKALDRIHAALEPTADFKPARMIDLFAGVKVLHRPNKELTPPRAVVTIQDVPAFTVGNISTIVGPPKAMKSTLAAVIANAYLLADNDFVKPGDGESAGGVLLVDTEQSEYYAQRLLVLACADVPEAMAERTTQIQVKSLVNPYMRLAATIAAIERHKPRFVITDGVADLVRDTNNLEEARAIVALLTTVAEENETHILNIIHTNKGSNAGVNPRGHLGGELERKAETVVTVQIDKENPSRSIVSALYCRNRKFQNFAIKYGDDNRPHIANIPVKMQLDSVGDLRRLAEMMEVYAKEWENHTATRSEMLQLIANLTNRTVRASEKVLNDLWSLDFVAEEPDPLDPKKRRTLYRVHLEPTPSNLNQ